MRTLGRRLAEPLAYRGLPRLTAAAVLGTAHPSPFEVATGVALTAGTANTAGSWVQLSSSLSAECRWLVLTVAATTANNAQATQSLIEIGVGGSGSEVTVLDGIQAGWQYISSQIAELPLFVAAGSRVSARCRSAVASKVVTIHAAFCSMPHPVAIPTAVPLGIHATLSQGTTLGAPGANDGTTYGAWTELSAATPTAFQGFYVMPGLNAQTSVSAQNFGVQLGVDVTGSGSWVAIGTLAVGAFRVPDAGEDITSMVNPVIDAQTPAGVRLGARYVRTGASSFDVIVHGIPA